MDPDEQLRDAARRGDLAQAEDALRQGANSCATSPPIGLCALHFAAQNGHDLLCELLLADSVDADPQDKHGRTPIQLAAVRGHVATVELLQEHGAELTEDFRKTMDDAVFRRCNRVHQIHLVHEGNVEAARATQRRRERIERQRQRKKLMKQDETIAGELEERDTKPVVDWWSEPKRRIAEVSRLYARPTYVKVYDDQSNGSHTKRVPFDTADALLDRSGWPKAQSKNGEVPQPYPCLCVSTPCNHGMKPDELGDIGGPGLRLYFFLLSFLYSAFFVMAVLSTPSVVINSDGNMYNHSEAARYGSTMAKTTLGNVDIDLTVLASGQWFGHKLWAISLMEAVGSLVMLAMVLRASGQMNKIAKDVDKSACTMGDYTVMVAPAGRWSFYTSVGKQKQKQLVEDVEETLEREISGSQIAELNGEPCIWIAWDDNEVITLWKQKAAALRQLEAALSHACKGNGQSTLKVLKGLDNVNRRIREINDTKSFTPVFVFATFQMSEHCEQAIARSEPVQIGGMQCQLLPAPEPGTLVWEHLQFSAKSRKRRKWCSITLTALTLIIGAAIITYASTLKAGVKYIDYCADVMGPEMRFPDVCPLPTESTSTAIFAADRNGFSERTVNNYRSKFIAVSDAAGQQFPRIDTAEIQEQLALPICGELEPDSCENDPHGFLRLVADTSCSDVTTLSSGSDSSGYQLMPAGELTCPPALEIATIAECEAAYEIMDNTEGFHGERGMQEVNQPDLPIGCSVQQPAGTNAGGVFDSSPHWNTFSGNSTGARANTGEFILLCKHWDTVAGCAYYFIPNMLQVKDLCPLSCDVPTTECRDDKNRYITGEGFVRTDDCHFMDMGHQDGPTEFLMRGGDVDAMCYACLCTLETVATERDEIESLYAGDAVTASDDPVAAFEQKLKATRGGYCEPMEQKKADAAIWGQVATVTVVLVNQVLKRGIGQSASFGKAHTIEIEMVSTALRVYVSQCLNTAILMLVVNSNFWVFGSLPGDHYDTVNAKWYATVATPLVQTMMIQFATPPSVHLVMHAVGCCKRRCVGRAQTQNLLNEALAPSKFEIAAAYGEILLAATVTLLFGAGVPLLYHVAAVGFFVRYIVERWVIVRVARRPPLYSKLLFDSFDEVFMLLLLVHAAMAVYFLSVAGGEKPAGYVFLKAPWAMHSHVWPMFVSFVCVLLGFVYKFGKCACVVTRRDRREAQKQQKERQRRIDEKRAAKELATPDTPESDSELCDSTDEEEHNPDFTLAYDKGLLVNEDDDYMMDQYENLLKLEAAFIEALEDQREKRQEPFDDSGFYSTCRAVVQPSSGDTLRDGPDHDAAVRYVKAQKERKRERVEAQKKTRKDADNSLATQAAILEHEQIVAAEAAAAHAAKQQDDLEQAELELELAETEGDLDRIAAAQQKLQKQKAEADAADAQAAEERARTLANLRGDVDAAAGELQKATDETTRRTQADAAINAKIDADWTEIDEIQLSIASSEKDGDIDDIEAKQALLASKKEIAHNTLAALPQLRVERDDAKRVQEEAERDLTTAQSVLSQYEHHLASASERVAQVEQDKEDKKRTRKVRTINLVRPLDRVKSC